VKEEIAQQNLDIFSDCSLAEISFALFFEKEFIAGLKKRQKSQDELLKKTAVLLKEIKDILFEMQQGELFDDDSTETFEQLREIIGEEQAGEVAKAFAGTMLYIPKNVIARNLHKRIKKEFLNGATYKELGRKYGYTERYIRDLVDRKKERQDGKA
jgi:Mor family transcriptional regulator